MQDFNRDYEDHVAGNYPQPDKDDLKNNWKVKLAVAVVLLIAIGSMVYMDITGQVGSWR